VLNPSFWARLHQALMPDYNRRATIYWWAVVPLGLAVVAWALATVAQLDRMSAVQVALGAGIAALAGRFPITLPQIKTSFALGEFFTFLLLFLFGPAAAVLAAVAESVSASAVTSKRWTSRIGGPAQVAIAAFVACSTLPWLQAAIRGPLGGSVGAGTQVILALWLAIAWFMLQGTLITTLPRLKRGEWPRWSDASGHFGFAMVPSVVFACAAAWLAETFRADAIVVMLTAAPAVGIVLLVVRSFIAQQEAVRALSQAEAQAARREADITARHLEEMHQIAFHDALTGLPNRRTLLEELRLAVERFGADQRQGYGLMFLDFDRFKLINDTLGHAAGDAFLVQVSQRLVAQVRDEDLVARLGGDEFAILLRRSMVIADIHDLAMRIQQAVCQPYHVAGTELRSSASIGITTSERAYTVPDDVLRDADIAMYRAKATGKARHVIFDARMHAELARRMRLEGDLRRALADEQLGLAYQPIHRLVDGQLIGFEALARWTHPEFGEVKPEEFVPIAEECGLAIALTDFMLERACGQLHTWHARGPQWEGLRMHVNLTDKDLAQRGLPERVSAVLLRSAVRPALLTLELTEGIIMRRIASERPTLLELRRLGVKLAIDDFGIGYSSLGQLSALPFDSLKVDRSFIAGLGLDEGASEIVRSILQLGHSLGRTTVAEAVETPAQLQWLREAGCDVVQGNALAEPMPADAVDALLERLEAGTSAARPQTGEPLEFALH
jgi:diguanylate cyclase (GGDEF)-like protein